MKDFVLPEHQIIAEALSRMDREYLVANECWFGGGTAIVLKLGEYRRSLDVDFLCASSDGYRELRSAATERGLKAFFPESIKAVRDFRIDQYGLRTVFEFREQLIKFEIIREGRIALNGRMDADLLVPALLPEDMFAEKLLANADRGQDRSVAYRDAFDLGVLVEHFGAIPGAAVEKATAAYGADIGRKLAWVVNRLQDAEERNAAAHSLMMRPDRALRAICELRRETVRLWPELEVRSDDI
ncbi:nucleotidyl transferase AbiEii/AbiGii toxin family protein [Neorhizobium galegae]|uniref:Nucleotidyl transferase AbiEii/AbiGii toxin family protein n=1 Tax=Neorhizobium galegae bv. orientalis str. HAMBI 540 TaxID=1028800 RepID=A0A068SPF6_NEOGA|nr:nucleotidyl transferase AbiEii/AbiGii toxin family protein [Neorhizobium galegae]MCQ1849870.1 nucleotidyl transferase AbiEii/AbiGii toxin family protein [Neorhizobium galegae]CDN46915.1 Hypothetical protein RG540_CH07260 [Neorhizobium galegae bv. orientalis str. HAMBI 540]CDZ53574.1 Conserved hypothetical protein [Neorhizobium galegae bv. orientalis]